MASNRASAEKSFFEQQRELLIQDVASSLENVLQNMNKLNRGLEGIIAVGNEFGHVEGLWSQFENVMAKQPEIDQQNSKEGQEATAEGRNR
ncbi:DASH complex subunit Dad1 [Polychaeton citri CBS 116435]|uniref:DASH complex subunit DAD1 n=1 Tax=Polychaeton citri CBS 116435 TaxID=1314669 RepID=A0A9P4UNL1_9PEZI|nr:DASH complex subunit Dad1 [Polychaeton citri CBS 116435]